jgi:hypothetical protein
LLKDSDLVSNPQFGYWTIEGETLNEEIESAAADGVNNSGDETEETVAPPVADQIIGSGKHCVYVYYYPTYRLFAEANEQKSWPCKIGMSEREPMLRILSQGATAMPEAPSVALLVRTDDAFTLEKALHHILKLRGKSIDAPGTEWFVTNPAEVEEIVRWLVV